MSHLPLDARAILQYLNDLGYRNISAEQLREFLKGMQPQLERCESSGNNKNNTQNNNKYNKEATATTSSSKTRRQQQIQCTPTTATTTGRTTPTTTTTPTTSKQVKVIKSKKPLCHFKFYLDICDHQLTKRIEEQIKKLGGNLEFFLTENVTHFITDKTVLPPLVASSISTNTSNNHNPLSNKSSCPATPQTPATPGTPLTPYAAALETNDARHGNNTAATPIGSARRTRQSRADAILNRARHQNSNSSTPTTTTTTTTKLYLARSTLSKQQKNSDIVATPPSYIIWQTEQALRFLKKIHTELREYLDRPTAKQQANNGQIIPLKGSFIKIEAIKRNFRPYYHLLKKPEEWPKINLCSDDGAFRLLPKQKQSLQPISQNPKSMTRKSRSSSKHLNNNNKTKSQQQQIVGTVTQIVPTAGLKKLESLKKQSHFDSQTTTPSKPEQTTTTTTTTPNICKEAKESSDKQCGVCEICKIEYDTLTIHLKTKDHEYFAKNPENFIALDTLIQSTADVNKFLAEEDIRKDKQYQQPEKCVSVPDESLEEMEVDEALCATEDNDIDPLQQQQSVNCNAITGAVTSVSDLSSSKSVRPSVILREKSKRSTKGKHSSEKFASAPTITPKSSPTKTPSPQKKLVPQNTSIMVEVQRIETCAAAVNTSAATPTTTTTRRKAIPASGLSPPIRAMLPPSSLYKVVETPEVCMTPVRSKRGLGAEEPNSVASPSIIVKFQKVRQTELERLNGEAENFMFPRTRSSSELPTDIDRQTTSDRARNSISSTSIDSTSEADIVLTLDETVTNRKKAIAKRHRASTSKQNNSVVPVSVNRQRFQSAPIQPGEQLIKNRTSVVSTKVITLPEATRKSSRTATAIVSAATTSSRLLRAAVEAAKNNNRKEQVLKPSPKAKPQQAAIITPNSRRVGPAIVARMEDRMGEEKSKLKQHHEENVNHKIGSSQCNIDTVKDDDEDDDEDEDNDDENDEDYVECKSKKGRKTAVVKAKDNQNVELRDVRTARRLSRLGKKIDAKEKLSQLQRKDDETANPKAVSPSKLPPRSPKGRFQKQINKKTKDSKSPKHKASSPQIFDYTKSERLGKLRYAFEELPKGDLWHQVYLRQDACEERYYTYFGSTNYRKLPYELGPIPFEKTTRQSCLLCNRNHVTTESTVNQNIKAKTEPEQKTLTKTEQLESIGITNLKTFKHKKLKLLERYQQQHNDANQSVSIKKKEKSPPKELEKYVASMADLSLPLQTENKINVEATETNITAIPASTLLNLKCDSKASTPELLERDFVPVSEMNSRMDRERAASTNSNASSSYASSTASMSKKQYRNKHLNRIAELPPRKSPREHASTLALVSCIIRQRQDSLSKNNSEVDEPLTPTPFECETADNIKEEFQRVPVKQLSTVTPKESKHEDEGTSNEPQLKTPLKQKTLSLVGANIDSSRTTRSAAATPIEELRFATEISENVKRMRRGQNKYDHSPPVVHKSANISGRGAPRGRPSAYVQLAKSSNTYSRRLVMAAKQDLKASVVLGKRKRREKLATAASIPVKQRSLYGSALTSTPSSIRKIGTKKGVMEFEVDVAAMKALDAATKYTNPSLESWLIDRYLVMSGKDYDIEATQLDMATNTEDTETELIAAASVTDAPDVINTPPPTDCFTSEFDLCDLLTGTGTQTVRGSADNDDLTTSRRDCFSFYNSTSLQSYFRKRKSLKANRTGWPKVQRKKNSTRQTTNSLIERIDFKNMGIVGGKDETRVKVEPIDIDEETSHNSMFVEQFQKRTGAAKNEYVEVNGGDDDGIGDKNHVSAKDDGEEGVITPPATDVDNEPIDDGDGVESIPDEDETIADSNYVENEAFRDADITATDADVEEEDDDDDYDDNDDDDIGENDDDDEDEEEQLDIEEEDQFEDAYDHDAKDVDVFLDAHTNRLSGETANKRDGEYNGEEEITNNKGGQFFQNNKHTTMTAAAALELVDDSPNKVLKALLNTKNSVAYPTTSTPSTQSLRLNQQFQQHHRRTPQMLNGSLGSCISPSEKLGDNSDIFTVSSDGLDTDLDLSNPHAATLMGEDQHQDNNHQCPHQTPKRKFDISKYAPNSAKASSCAAEAATAAVKSLAISQFLKKEVRVTCRRLRAPFRRFRYRR